MNNVGFNNYSNIMDIQIRESMKEKFSTFEKESIQKCTASVNDTFKPYFNREIAKLQNETGQKDLINILGVLKNAYLQAGMQKDAEAMSNQIKKLNLEA